MASEVEIANAALTSLGESRIVSLDDDVKAAREVKAIFTLSRDALLAGYNWSFAMFSQSLTALAEVPPFDYSYYYQLPSECLRIIRVGDIYAGVDLVDYRGTSTEEFRVEGRKIATSLSAPLPFRGVQRVTDTTLFSASFNQAFAAYLSSLLAEPLTQSQTKRDASLGWMKREISLAVRANAIELPPKQLADDSWLLSRL